MAVFIEYVCVYTYNRFMDKETFLQKVMGQPCQIIKPLVGGMMNELYLFSCLDKKYLLYISTEQANEMVDRPLEKEHIDIVNSLGITNKNIYFDPSKGIKINEYIEGDSLDHISDFDYDKVANLLHALHDSGKRSKEDYNPFKRFEGYYQEASEFVKEHDPHFVVLKNFLMENKEFLEKQEKVLAHNDAQRSNIVRGNNGRYYLIDFEFMANNDPIYDIATFGNGDVLEGYYLLKHYYLDPSEEQKQRYFLWRIYVSLQWYLVALVKHYRGEGEIHHYNFLAVADHFLNNAQKAYQGYKSIGEEENELC